MTAAKKGKKHRMTRFLNGVEKLGNRLPHPIALFGILTLLVVLLSAVFSWTGLSADGEMGHVAVKSLLDKDGLTYMLTNVVSNFTGFAPFGVVLVTMLGVGCAEGSGLLSAALKKLVSITPKAIITPMIVFLGVLSNVAADIGYVVLIPLGAMVFQLYGRHPLAGLAAAFAGVSGGFSANLLIGALDPMLAGITTEAAGLLDPDYVVGASDNWYFMMASTLVIVAIGSLVTDKIVEPRLSAAGEGARQSSPPLSKRENRALLAAGLVFVLLAVGLVLAALPKDSLLRNPETGSLVNDSPLIKGLIPLIALLFFIPSAVYGRMAGTYKDTRAVCGQLEKNMSSMGAYIALIFMASQLVSFFNYSNLGAVLAMKGAGLLRAVDLPGPVLMALFVLFTSLVNLIMGSASAKWTIFAPVFAPMFMLLGYSPALTQVAYRIGDSCTNLITPLMSYFPMVVVFARQYDHKAGVGTIAASMLPYSFFFLIGWTALLALWMLAGLPLGPGVSLMMEG